MAFDPLSWAIGFALTQAAEQLLRSSDAKALRKDLRDRVIEWSRALPEELSDLHPDPILNRLFKADSKTLGPKRRRLRSVGVLHKELSARTSTSYGCQSRSGAEQAFDGKTCCVGFASGLKWSPVCLRRLGIGL